MRELLMRRDEEEGKRDREIKGRDANEHADESL